MLHLSISYSETMMPRPDGAPALSTATVLTLALALGLAGGVGGTVATSAITGATSQRPADEPAAVGTPGQPGERGAPGSAGEQGSPGVSGKQGEQGTPGVTGERGPAGPSGSSGTKGDTGAEGTQGVPGAPGLMGPVGPIGPIGVRGIAGAIGPVGPEGPAGSAGAKGEKGNKGDAGADGAKGDTGPKGDTGVAGAKGDTGPEGPAGPAGASAVVSYSVFTARPLLAQGTAAVQFTDEVSSPTPAASNDGSTITLPESGTYRLTYVAAPDSSVTTTISVSRDSKWVYGLFHNVDEAAIGTATPIAGSAVERSMLDVNIALVLSMRTVVQGGSYSATSYVDAAAGDTVRFVSASDFQTAATPTDVTLIVERLT